MTIQPNLWKLVASSAGDPAAFRKLLVPASTDELVRLHAWATSDDEALNPARLRPRAPAPFDAAAVIADVYRGRTGAEIPAAEPTPPADLAPTPADETDLWKLIDMAELGIPLVEALASRTRAAILRLSRAYDDLYNRLNARTDELGEDPNGAGWASWVDWIIQQGRDVYERTLADPAAAPHDVPYGSVYFTEALRGLYTDRYGEDP